MVSVEPARVMHPDSASHHGHDHPGRHAPTGRLAVALVLTVSFLAVELVAGWWTGSLALLSDAGHMATDAGALIVALFAQVIAGRARSGARTFGYRRAEILAALGNGVVLGAASVWIVVEAIRRLGEAPEVDGLPMLVVAAIGLAINLAAAAVLSGAGHGNANVRAAAAHVMSDALGSLAAIVAGLAIWLYGWHVVDPLASLLISVLILRSAWKIVAETIGVLMEGTPMGLDYQAIEVTIRETPGVAGMHDLHVWSISEGFPAITVHVILDGTHHGTEVAAAVCARLRRDHGVDHVTVQPEAPAPPLVPLENVTRRAR
jgi:cobalt-zinc-cadmium efflux system protein